MTQQQTITLESTTVEPSSGFTDFVLGRLHVAELRAKITANDIKATATKKLMEVKILFMLCDPQHCRHPDDVSQ